MKTNNQTTTTKATETKNHLQTLQEQRNNLVNLAKQNCYFIEDLQIINGEIMQKISEIATYKTLRFLIGNNATNGTTTETTENGTTNTTAYNMGVKLLNEFYNDVKLLNNPLIIGETMLNAADLIQESNKILTPYFSALVEFSLTDTIYTKQLKNGNVKNYTAFTLACKSIREYIREQDKKQYKKLSYCIGFTDSGTEVLTTKKPKNNIADIEQEQRTAFISKYHLTDIEQTALLYKLNGLNTTATAEKLQVSKRTIERALKNAKEKIANTDKRIRL